MRVRLTAYGLIVGLASVVALPAHAAPFTLAEALGVAYETNPQLASARAALDALDQGVAQANAGWRPSINANGSYGVENGIVQGIAAPFNSHPLIGQVTVSEPLFRGGRTVAEVGRAIALVHAGRAQLVAAEQAVLLAAVTAYADVVRDEAIQRLNEDNVRTLETELASVRTELSVGAVTRTDALQAEARLARAKSDLAVAQLRLAASRSAFENVIGRPAETLQDDAHLPGLPASEDAALAIALKQNPDLLQAWASAKAANYGIDDAAGALLPQLSIAGQYQYLRDAAGTNIFATKSPQQILNVLGQVTIPIYQGGGDEATVRRAKDLYHKSQIDIVTTERNVRQDVDSAWTALIAEKVAMQANEAEATADSSAVAGVAEERRGGERSELDVLNAQQEYINAQIAAATSRHDYALSAYRVLSATGELTARFLGLNVRLYDPREHYDDNADAWFGFGR
ncbi:MAG TPA: TolC family outer membrane protein [Rhizomicrobium sp.]|nr:TolC family outer membrane protein [Rhizomicrobium sp.]